MLRELHDELGIPEDYGQNGGPPVFDEALDLVDIGPNLVGRAQQLTPAAAKSWKAMRAAANTDGVTLMIVSGFRSVDYQARLIRKKINAGQAIEEILEVNAAPGYSEHHTGLAVDIATPGSRPLGLMEKCRARIAREETMLEKIAAGRSTVELLDLPPLKDVT